MNKRLLKEVQAAEEEAKDHPSPPALTFYALTPDLLCPSDRETIEPHLKTCLRCKKEADDTKSKGDFFNYQRANRGDR